MGQNQTKIDDEIIDESVDESFEENFDENVQKYEKIKHSAKENIEKAKKMLSKPYMLTTRD